MGRLGISGSVHITGSLGAGRVGIQSEMMSKKFFSSVGVKISDVDEEVVDELDTEEDEDDVEEVEVLDEEEVAEVIELDAVDKLDEEELLDEVVVCKSKGEY